MTTIGIIGTGAVTEQYHLPVLLNIPNIKIAWLCDSDITKARGVAKSFKLDVAVEPSIDKLPDVDACLVATPLGTRNSLISNISDRGWHLLCEKPFAVNAVDHKSWCETFKKKGLTVGAGFMRRYYHGTILARNLIQSEAHGRLLRVQASQGARMRGTGRASWYQGDRTSAGGGVLLETGSHLIDQAISVIEPDDFSISSVNEQRFQDLEVDVKINSQLTRKNRALDFTVQVSKVQDLFTGIIFNCTHASVEMSVMPDSPLKVRDTNGNLLYSPMGPIGARHVYQAFYFEWMDFLNSARLISATPPNHPLGLIHASESFLTTRFIEASYEQSNQRSAVAC